MSLKKLIELALDFDALKNEINAKNGPKGILLEDATPEQLKKSQKIYGSFQKEARLIKMTEEEIKNEIRATPAEEISALVRLANLVCPIEDSTLVLANIIAKGRLQTVQKLQNEKVFGQHDLPEQDIGVIVHHAKIIDDHQKPIKNENDSEENLKSDSKTRVFNDLSRLMAGESLNEKSNRAIKAAINLSKKTEGVRMVEGEIRNVDSEESWVQMEMFDTDGNLLPPPKRKRGRPAGSKKKM